MMLALVFSLLATVSLVAAAVALAADWHDDWRVAFRAMWAFLACIVVILLLQAATGGLS